MDQPIPHTTHHSGEIAGNGGGLTLTLTVTDPEVVLELEDRKSPEREQYALQCLRVGVLALRAAGGAIDAEAIRHEGTRLVNDVEAKLKLHSTSLNQRLEGELKRYFDPDSGSFEARVKQLVADDGLLVTLLKRHLDGDSGLLARQLAQAVGENSPLMKHLDPKQKDGLIETLTTIVQERLEAQTQKVLGEFDLNNEEGALKRLIKNVQAVSDDLGKKFDPADEGSPIGVINKALASTREQLQRDLSLDHEGSPLSNLHGKLKAQIDELVTKQNDFQNKLSEAIGELRGVKQERDKSTAGGFDFETQVEEALRPMLPDDDLLVVTGTGTGLIPNSKVGDLVQTLGEESAAPGRKIVYECKRDSSYTRSKALEELDTARRNRGADVGVFVVAQSSVLERDRMAREFEARLSRRGPDIIVRWDPAEENDLVVLEAAVMLARWMVLKGGIEQDEQEGVDWELIDKAIESLNKQLGNFDELYKLCNNITRDAGKIQERLDKMTKAIERDLGKLRAQLEALRP